MVEAVISVDAYPFFTILRTDLLHCRYKNRCFLAALCCLIVKRENLKIVAVLVMH